MRRQLHSRPAKRRTTLTLPVDTLSHAEQIARQRKVNLSSVIAEALEEGLRFHAAAQRSEKVLKAYQQPFAGLSDQEVMILDGIILEPASARHA
jgi:post-segregation antitoxin (ccd killing protein)